MPLRNLRLIFQSTLSVRRATAVAWRFHDLRYISIHALRKESDACALMYSTDSIFQSTLSVRRATYYFLLAFRIPVISIHALRKESDATTTRKSNSTAKFQSTLSVRRATKKWDDADTRSLFQSTLSVRRATLERGLLHPPQ